MEIYILESISLSVLQMSANKENSGVLPVSNILMQHSAALAITTILEPFPFAFISDFVQAAQY